MISPWIPIFLLTMDKNYFSPKKFVCLPWVLPKPNSFVPNSSFARLTIKLEGQDELSIDDNRTVWVTAPPSRKFGFWSSESPQDMDLLEKNYLSVALESSGDGGWDRWEHANDLAERMKSPQSRSQLNVLGLIGASDWLDNGELSQALSLFLGSGGTVFATPGESPVRMNQTFKKHALLDFTFSASSKLL